MSWGVYSERFVLSQQVNAWLAYTVPVGKRAVVKSITATCSDGAGGRVDVAVAGIYVGVLVLPASIGSKTLEVMAVAYAGEAIGVYQAGSQLHVSVAGYLLDDPSGAKGPPLAATGLPAPIFPDPPIGASTRSSP